LDASQQRAALHVWRSLAGAYGAVFRNLGPLARAASLPFLVSYVLVMAPVALDPRATPPWLDGLAVALAFLPATLFAVAWHRLLLLGGAVARPSWRPSLRVWHGRYLGFALLLLFAALLVSLLVGAAGAVALSLLAIDPAAGDTRSILAGAGAGLVAVLAAVWLVARLGFTLPAAAVGLRYGLRESWRATRGLGLDLLALMVLVSLPLLLLAGALATLLINVLPPTPGPSAILAAGIALRLAISYIWLALVLAALSIAFRSHGAPPGAGLDLAGGSVSSAAQR